MRIEKFSVKMKQFIAIYDTWMKQQRRFCAIRPRINEVTKWETEQAIIYWKNHLFNGTSKRAGGEDLDLIRPEMVWWYGKSYENEGKGRCKGQTHSSILIAQNAWWTGSRQPAERGYLQNEWTPPHNLHRYTLCSFVSFSNYGIWRKFITDL